MRLEYKWVLCQHSNLSRYQIDRDQRHFNRCTSMCFILLNQKHSEFMSIGLICEVYPIMNYSFKWLNDNYSTKLYRKMDTKTMNFICRKKKLHAIKCDFNQIFTIMTDFLSYSFHSIPISFTENMHISGSKQNRVEFIHAVFFLIDNRSSVNFRVEQKTSKISTVVHIDWNWQQGALPFFITHKLFNSLCIWFYPAVHFGVLLSWKKKQNIKQFKSSTE